MLDASIVKQLDQYLGFMKQPIEIKLASDDSAKGIELRELATTLAERSDKITLSEWSHKRVPSMGICAQGESEPRVIFSGIPMGHEFTSLILALLNAGGHPSREPEEVQEQIKTLEGEMHFETYISLSCQNCPDLVQALNLMARLNPNITSTMIDGAIYQDEVEERQVMAVPAVYLNGELFTQGRTELKEMLARLDTAGAAKQAEALSEREPYDVLVVGGGPAGAAAAIYAARKGIRTGLVAERFGGQVQDTVGIENLISVPYTEGPKLVSSMEQHVKEYDVDIITSQRANKLSELNGLHAITTESGATLKAKTLILATGARWRELNVPGEAEYRGKGVAYCPHCDGPLFKGKRVAVIGGGNSGIEAAIDLAGIVAEVTVLEFGDTLRADQVLQNKANSMPNITIIKNAQTTEVTGDGNKVNGITYNDRVSGESHHIELEGIFVQIGLVPNTEWLKESALELTKFGEIQIDAKGATNLAGVFGAGDATTVPYKQIIISMGAGATAALSAFDHLIRN
ncbi:alkyl hydroperoxide reductase subunit F [Marinobacterium sp. LSUCC0821]|uniref:alkyl hydroperoxide reductase subunit F n=1 Tax=Marinobacterium sp. LSUCC0821 TaxID=2668067 RepID=UPI0014525607|nr:alkyl hydroperoxide reductase subunit F [Marinobacterium sp. LSUCC0821]QJD71201.1 alkyl hydroperoxide reductase subunit F [Marinobacterium sp. LSUCC0821]